MSNGTPSISSSSGGGKVPGSLITTTYNRINEDIIHGRHPPDVKLRLAELGETYGVSVGTVREALSLLVSDHLVVPLAQRGFRVVPISLADWGDVTRTRILLEGQALRESIANGDDQWEGRIVYAYHQLSLAEHRLSQDPSAFAEWEKRNSIFHDALVSASDSPWTLRCRSMLYRHAKRYRQIMAKRWTQSIGNAHDEHKVIYDFVLSRKADESVEALGMHISSPYRHVRDNNLFDKIFGKQ